MVGALLAHRRTNQQSISSQIDFRRRRFAWLAASRSCSFQDMLRQGCAKIPQEQSRTIEAAEWHKSTQTNSSSDYRLMLSDIFPFWLQHTTSQTSQYKVGSMDRALGDFLRKAWSSAASKPAGLNQQWATNVCAASSLREALQSAARYHQTGFSTKSSMFNCLYSQTVHTEMA